MLDGDRPLPEVITQVRAVRAALGSAANVLLSAHVEDRATEVLTTLSQRERHSLVSELVHLLQKRDP
jgi:DNA-binding FrmR family transcriptional regulator